MNNPTPSYSLCFDGRVPKYIHIYDHYIRNKCPHVGTAMTKQPVSSSQENFYFEVTVEEFSGTQLCLGFVTSDNNCFQLPGEKAGIGYRNDGRLLDGNGLVGAEWAGCLPWGTAGDTIGLGLNIVTGEVYCTKNGQFLCTVFKHIFADYFNEDEGLYPAVSIAGNGCLSVNLGNDPFRFDLSDILRKQKASRLSKLSKVNVSLSDVNDLVKDYLLYRGYGKTYDCLAPNSSNMGTASQVNSSNWIPATSAVLKGPVSDEKLARGPDLGLTDPFTMDIEECQAKSKTSNLQTNPELSHDVYHDHETEVFHALVDLFKPTHLKQCDIANNSSKVDRKVTQNLTSNKANSQKDIDPGPSVNDKNRNGRSEQSYSEEQSDWGVWRQVGGDPNVDRAIDIHHLTLKPSYSSCLKYHALIHSTGETTTSTCGQARKGKHANGNRGRASSHGRIKVSKDGTNNSLIHANHKSDFVGPGLEELQLFSFPIQPDDNLADLSLSTIKFRAHCRMLLMTGNYTDVRRVLSNVLPDVMYQIRPACEGNQMKQVVFGEVWVMLHCLEFIEVFGRGALSRTIGYARCYLYPFLMLLRYTDGESTAYMNLVDEAHEEAVLRYIDSLISGRVLDHETTTFPSFSADSDCRTDHMVSNKKRNRESSCSSEEGGVQFDVSYCNDGVNLGDSFPLLMHMEPNQSSLLLLREVSQRISTPEREASERPPRPWTEHGIRHLLISTIGILSYEHEKLDISELLKSFRCAVSDYLNEQMLLHAARKISRLKGPTPAGAGDQSCAQGGIRDYGTVLELCLQRLVDILKSVEDLENRSSWDGKWVLGKEGKSFELGQIPSLYGTGCLLTFNEERQEIFELMHPHKGGDGNYK